VLPVTDGIQQGDEAVQLLPQLGLDGCSRFIRRNYAAFA
jgi:hypothetical protein